MVSTAQANYTQHPLMMPVSTHSSALSRVTDALTTHGSRGKGSAWTCPVHDDRTASLSVNNGSGKVVMMCHAGCSTEEIVAELGLDMKDLFDEPIQCDEPVRYPYTDEDGTVLYYKVRGDGKTFWHELPGGGKKLGSVRRVPYNLPALITAVKNGEALWYVEGEKDADRLTQMGLAATTSGGCKSWRSEFAEYFRGADVTIVADNDLPGFEHAEAVARALREVHATVRVVKTPLDQVKADVSDHLDADMTLDGLVPLSPETVTETVKKKSSWGRVDLSTILDGTAEVVTPTIGQREDGAGLFYPGREHSIVAETESGKTWFMLAACKTEMDRRNAVLYMDFEDDASGIVPRLINMGVEPATIEELFIYVRPEETVNWAELQPIIDETGPVLAIIDGVTEAMGMNGLDLLSNKDVARFRHLLARPLAEQGMAVVSSDHVVKDREARNNNAMGGIHKVNGLNGAMYILENKDPIGVGLRGLTKVYIRKDRPGQLRKNGRATKDKLFWYCDMVVDCGQEAATVSLTVPDEPGEFRPTTLMSRVCEALSFSPEPLSFNKLHDRVGGNEKYLNMAITQLIKEHYVVIEPGPRKSNLHRLVKPWDDCPLSPTVSRLSPGDGA